MALEHELQVYRLHLIDMLGDNDVNEGKYTVIKDDVIAGVWPTRQEALAAAYEWFGLGPFLVKKLERNETDLYFSRDLR